MIRLTPPSATRLALCTLVLMIAAASAEAGKPDLPAAAAALEARDRELGTRNGDTLSVLAELFDEQVIMPVQGVGFADGEKKALEALSAQPNVAGSRMRWQPVRVGVSADGAHGLSYGYFVMTGSDGSESPGKYLSYWIKRDGEWRVAGYKRSRQAAGAVSMQAQSPWLPARALAANPAKLADYRVSLSAQERAFSNRAQVIGLGPAFEEFGRADSINLGGAQTTEVIVGAANIGKLVSQGEPGEGSSVEWAADHQTLVAASGDLGVTFGFIKVKQPEAGKPAPIIPFFTIWARAGEKQPWRYIAE